MSIASALTKLVIGPLELLLELVFSLARQLGCSPGPAILLLSLAVNLLVLPLYRRVDALQLAERDRAASMAARERQIRRAFRGDERYFMLRTYYRQSGYSPLASLRGLVPLLLELPFFFAAYRFLSGLELLQGAAFGPIRDLGAPDGLLALGSLRLNLLPLLMTAVNLIAAAVFLRGFPRRSRLQSFGLALLFLALLYTAPAGLSLYWTANNLFSLVKNLLTAQRADRPAPEQDSGPAPDGRAFLLGCLFLTLLTGLVIPTAVLRSSPGEFTEFGDPRSPLWLAVSALLTAAGTFLLWGGVLYRLTGRKGKRVLEGAAWLIAGLALMNYLFFGTGYGNLSSLLVYDTPPAETLRMLLVNLVVLLLVGALLGKLRQDWPGLPRQAALCLCLAALVMSALNLGQIQSALRDRDGSDAEDGELPTIELSRRGKNVVVLMMDRAISGYIPFLFEEKPELQRQFAGFTYYPNTISFGQSTNFGVPPVFGGYEYTPEQMNLRRTELLEDKHNEALLVLPRLFSEAGWRVTVYDPPYAGYDWVSDLSVYEPYPGVKAGFTQGLFTVGGAETARALNAIRERSLFCYALMKISPLAVQPLLYDGGRYGRADSLPGENEAAEAEISTQTMIDFSHAEGLDKDFMRSYAVLQHLPAMTRITDDETGTLLLMDNDTTHSMQMLSEPSYEPAAVVDNETYDREHRDRLSTDGRVIHLDDMWQVELYHVNMASLLKLGDWFDYLRQQGVYDNTRIIVVSDHGWPLGQFQSMLIGSDWGEDVMRYNPVLLVKDFDSQELSTDWQYMTNADVPTLVTEDLIEEPVNPFTGKALNSEAKDTISGHLVFWSADWNIYDNNGTTFHPGVWYHVGDNLFDPAQWTKMLDETAG